MSGFTNPNNMDPWSTQGLLNDPVINPGGTSVPPQQQQQQRQPYQYPPQAGATTTAQLAPRTKRPRSASPAAPSKRNKASHSSIPDSILLASQLKDPATRNEALKTLLKLSSSADVNYSLAEVPHGTVLLQALIDVVHDECLDYKTHVDKTKHLVEKPVFDASKTWTEPPTQERAAWIHHVQQHFQQGDYNTKLLQTILIILRNFSYVSSNVRLLRQEDFIWSILIACLYEPHHQHETHDEFSSLANHNLALHALSTLLNLSQQPQLDVSGQLQVCDALFLQDSPLPQLGWGGMQLAKRFNTKEDSIDAPPIMVKQIASSHLIQIWTLFSAIQHVITNPTTPRSLLMVALDFLKECLDQVGSVVSLDVKEEIPSMGAILKELPFPIMEKCVDCLWIPRLGPDALDYVNPLHTMVARVSALKLKMGYDATVDTDLRDRALDVLVPWLSLDEVELGTKLAFQQNRKDVQTKLYDALVPILTTRVGRNDAPLLATQVLKYMASSKENEAGLLYIQERILELASRDARVAQLAFTHLYARDEQGDSGEEEQSEQEEGS